MADLTCEVCGATVAANAMICQGCGSDVSSSPPPAPRLRPTDERARDERARDGRPRDGRPRDGRPPGGRAPGEQSSTAVGVLPCADPDCGHGGFVPARRCADCGRAAGAPPASGTVVDHPAQPRAATGGAGSGHVDSGGVDSGGAGSGGAGSGGAAPGTVRLRFPWGGEELAAGGVVRVGRESSPFAERLSPYANVSRRHAEFRSTGGQLLVIDQQSVNGTFVNDEQLEPMRPHVVRPGDVVRFGAGLRVVIEEVGRG